MDEDQRRSGAEEVTRQQKWQKRQMTDGRCVSCGAKKGEKRQDKQLCKACSKHHYQLQKAKREQ